MKQFPIWFFALVSLAGITGAFANKTKPKPQSKFLIYYGVSDGAGGFKWQTHIPYGYTCVSCAPYCTIATRPGYIPIDNQVPTNELLIYHSSFNSVYSQ